MTSPWIQELVDVLAPWMPVQLARLAVAAAIVLVGYVVARLARFGVTRLLRRLSGRLVAISVSATRRSGADVPVEQAAGAEEAALRVAGRVVFWLVFALFLGAATTVLGFPVLSAWLEGLAAYLPRALAAAAIVLVGVLSGLFARILVATATVSISDSASRSLGQLAQVALVALATAIAIDVLGIDVTILIVLAAVMVGTALGGLALAFGLGARASVENLLAGHYLARSYRVGHLVRVGEHQGRIVEIASGALVLETELGRVRVPAALAAAGTTVLVAEEIEA